MLSKKVVAALNGQINKEFYSAYLYVDVSNYYADLALDGFANWYDVQAKEELDHASLMQQYLHDNGEKVVLEAISKPALEFKDMRTGVAGVLEHEQYITAAINDVYTIAMDEKDFRTMKFLDWFIDEQREEEKNADGILRKFDLLDGKNGKNLYLLDKDLATRTYAAPSLVL